MTAEHGPERRLSVEEELAVTRALRDLPEPSVPPALAARLDARLAELEAERSDPAPAAAAAGAPTVLATRRRWPRLLLAAAVVLVGGYAVGTAVDGSITDGSGESSSGSAAAPAAGDSEGGGTPAGQGSGRLAPRASTVALHHATLRSDVRRLLRTTSPAPTGAGAPGGVRSPAGCRPPRGGAGATVWAVRYDGARAFLVTHPVDGGRVRAVVYSCGPRSVEDAPLSAARASVPATSITVRAP
jgi:hypothetical protein